MNQHPEISIVMPLYNKEKEVGRALASVFAQTFADFELIVVNDGSTDHGPDVVAKHEDQRIRLINQPNQGVSAARNRGITEAKADLIAFLDSDDEWLPDFLETICRLETNFPDCTVYATSYFLRAVNGHTRPAILRGIDSFSREGVLMDYFAIAAKSDPPIWSSAVAMSKQAIDGIGGFPEGIVAGEDLLTWAKLALHNQIAYSSQPLAVFWMPSDVYDRPGRFDNTEDSVEVELVKLYADAPDSCKVGLRAYIALWYKMRAVVFLELGRRTMCLHHVAKSIQYGGALGRLGAITLFAICPYPRPARLLSALKGILRLAQNIRCSKKGRKFDGKT